MNLLYAELRKQNRQGHARQNRQMQRRSCRCTQRFRRKGTCRTALSRGGSDCASSSESGRRTDDRSYIPGILDSREHD